MQHSAWEKTSKIDDAEPGSMRDGVGSADRVEFVGSEATWNLAV